MPVYHFTLHAYRSWSPNHKRGYTRRGEGYLKFDADRAREYDAQATQDEAVFDEQVQCVIIRAAFEFCERRRMRLHGIGNEDNHTHLVLSWRTFMHWHEVMRRLKNILSTALGKELKQPGRKWFVRGGSRKRVTNPGHLTYLTEEYLPSHGGIFWREGQPLP